MRPVVRKKAALCLLRLMRKTPADAQMVTADSFAPIMAQLLEERDLGMLLCCVTLLLGICARTGSGKWLQEGAACSAAAWRPPLLLGLMAVFACRQSAVSCLCLQGFNLSD